MTRRVAIVPHTHWDREWYAPYQDFRMRLVDLLDDLLPRLEDDPSYAHFMLDGQMAVVDDYLEVRPHEEDRLRRLTASGRLSVGPWYILVDEFLVSGETMVRDLQLGLERAAAFGGAMEVGYLPDMFGHVAQMPQLLAQFGLEHAVVWRGVPAAVTSTGFRWEAPDGSSVRAEYLPQGYGNGAYVPKDAKALLARVEAFVDDSGELLDGDVLWMNGTDHLMPVPHLGRVVAEANALQEDYELVVTSLAEHLARRPTEGLQTWRGELRSGARANLLMGVASNRTDVKQAAATAERELERLAEPLSALFLPADRWPSSFLALAWREVIRNAAHDSICACSHDEVVDAVLHRFAEARQIGEGLTERALDSLAASLAEPGATVVNPSARRRGGLVELTIPGTGDVGPDLQLLRERGDVVLGPVPLREGAVVTDGALENAPWIRTVTIDDAPDGGLLVVLHTPGTDEGEIAPSDAKDRIRELAADEPERPVTVTIRRAPSRKVLARVGDVAGFGWRRWEADALDVAPVAVDDRSISNGLVSVTVADDGTFALDGLAGLDRLVDDGDVGDTYNWCPPEHDLVVDAPVDVSVRALEHGPLRGRLEVVRRYDLPERAEAGARTGTVPTTVTTVLEVRAGSPLVHVTASLTNASRDHRLRTHLPLPSPASTSRAECAFAVVERGLVAEGGPTEPALATYPSRRFVQAGGLTVVHEGLLEYELVDLDGDGDAARAGALALTLVRSTGMLSQGPMPTRPLPAGPFDRLEGAQLQGPITLRYGVAVGDHDPYALVDELSLPLRVVQGTGGGDRPATGSALTVEGAEVSAVQRHGERLSVRVFNPTDDVAAVSFGERSGWLVDLRGRALEHVDGGFDLRPWGLATIVLDA